MEIVQSMGHQVTHRCILSVGEDVLIGSGVIVDHDCRIGDHYCIFVEAVLGGGVQVGPFALIGQSAAIGK